MRIDRLTTRSREALFEAQNEATKKGNPELQPEHFLRVLLTQADGVAAPVVEKAGGDVISEGKNVTYDLKPNRTDPTAVGTSQMADAICKRIAELG